MIAKKFPLAFSHVGVIFSLVVLAGCFSSVSSTAVSEPPADAPTKPVVEAESEASAAVDVEKEVENVSETIHPNSGQTTYHTLELDDGTILEYAAVLPESFNPNEAHPILLAFPPGPQNRSMVDAGLDGYWAETAIERDWVVLSPTAPDGVLFFQGSEVYLLEFLNRMAEIYRPEGEKYHLAGISNGGLSAFRVALQHPERFHSLIALPGFPRTQEEFQQLETLTGIPVALFVGEQDSGWREAMVRTEKELARLGGNVSVEIVPGEGHVIRSLTGEELFDLLESYR